ncbi:unnamed protein product [Boreogadus saida]
MDGSPPTGAMWPNQSLFPFVYGRPTPQSEDLTHPAAVSRGNQTDRGSQPVIGLAGWLATNNKARQEEHLLALLKEEDKEDRIRRDPLFDLLIAPHSLTGRQPRP